MVSDVHGNFSISKSFLFSLWKTKCHNLSNVPIPMQSDSLFLRDSINYFLKFFIISLFKSFSPNFSSCCWCLELHVTLKALSFVPTLQIVLEPVRAGNAGSMHTSFVTDSWTRFICLLCWNHSLCRPCCFWCCSKLCRRLVCTPVSLEQTNAALILSTLTAWLTWYGSLSSAFSCSHYNSVTTFIF